MHFDSETCTCTDNCQVSHAYGQGETLTCVWQFMGKNTTIYLYCIAKENCIVYSIDMPPVGTRGYKSRMCPPYPHACRKRRLKWGAVI